MRKIGVENKGYKPKYPDMRLYQEVIFLDHHFSGDWVVENVKPYYEPLIEAQAVGRHYFWGNFVIQNLDTEPTGVCGADSVEQHEERLGFDLSSFDIKYKKKLKMLRNCVEPNVGLHVLNCRSTSQTSLDQVGVTL